MFAVKVACKGREGKAEVALPYTNGGSRCERESVSQGVRISYVLNTVVCLFFIVLLADAHLVVMQVLCSFRRVNWVWRFNYGELDSSLQKRTHTLPRYGMLRSSMVLDDKRVSRHHWLASHDQRAVFCKKSVWSMVSCDGRGGLQENIAGIA